MHKKTTKFSITFTIMYILAILHSCRAYSFSGTKLAKEIKTFSIESCDSTVAMGPANLTDIFSQNFTNTVMETTQLKEKLQDGDVQFKFAIVNFYFSPIATKSTSEDNIGSIQRLTVDVEVSYTNRYDENSCFKKRTFSQFSDIPADADSDAEEPRLIQEIFAKLAQDIINSTVADW